jgi:pimeloyl-ACP methyl ester carboxylesterase
VATFLLVHGAWHDGACWDAVRAELEELGHRTAAPDLPVDDPAAGWERHAETVAGALGDDPAAIVVAHSWAGRVLPLVASLRPVSRLVYLCARIPATRSDEPVAYRPGAFEGIEERPDGSRIVVDPAHMYGRVPAAVAARAAAGLRPQYWPEPPELDVRAHPRAYILCREDEFAPLEWSRWAAREMLGVEPIELEGGHFPMLEQPAALARILAGLDEKGT